VCACVCVCVRVCGAGGGGGVGGVLCVCVCMYAQYTRTYKYSSLTISYKHKLAGVRGVRLMASQVRLMASQAGPSLSCGEDETDSVVAPSCPRSSLPCEPDTGSACSEVKSDS